MTSRARPATPPPREVVRERNLYQLKITLLQIEPPIWRRIQVPGALTLDRVHRVLQRAMGWTGAHLHEFVIGGRRYGQPDPERAPTEVRPERAVTLREVASSELVRFEYLYDFGDNWRHEVVVERILPADTAQRAPVCLGGERCCPPEDCGGVGGYEAFLEAIRDASHPQHDEMLEWVGGPFDPDAFNLEDVNRAGPVGQHG